MPGATAKLTTCSALRPRSTRLTFARLRTKRPADTSRAMASAIWAVARPVRNQCGLPGAARLAGLILERGEDVGPRAVQRRRQPEHQRGRQGQAAGEQQRPPVEREGHHGFRRLRRHEECHGRQRPPRHQQPAQSAQHGQHARLGEQLADELPAAAADRKAHGHLARAPRGPHQQQVRDVGAGNQQHDGGDGKQEREGCRHHRVHAALPPCALGHRHLLRAEARHHQIAGTKLQRGFDLVEDPRVWHVDRRPRVLDGHSGLQPGEDVHPVPTALLQRVRPRARTWLETVAQGDGQEDGWADAQGGAGEAARRHADNRHRVVVHEQRPAEDARVRTQLGAPVVVAENRDVRPADDIIVRRNDEPAHRGNELKHGEIAARDEHPRRPGAGRAARRDDRHVHGTVRRHGHGVGGEVLELLVHRVAEHLGAAPGPVAVVAAGLGAWRAEVHQRARVGYGQGTHQRLLEHGEDGGVGANT
jgi:hypothetical protein